MHIVWRPGWRGVPGEQPHDEEEDALEQAEPEGQVDDGHWTQAEILAMLSLAIFI